MCIRDSTKEKPRETLVRLSGRRLLGEEAADHSTVGRDAGSSCDHDVVHVWVFLGHEHNLSARARHHDRVAGLEVAEVVGADAFLGRVLCFLLGTPGGSVIIIIRGERANLKGLVLGCIEAKFCKKICVGIRISLKRRLRKKGTIEKRKYG